MVDDNSSRPEFVSDLQSTLDVNTLELTKSMRLMQFPDGYVKDGLTYAYNSDNAFYQVIAILTVAAVASRKSYFVFSRGLLHRYIKNDPNLKSLPFVDGKVMRKINGMITKCGFVERIKESSGSNAAEYRIIHKEVLKLISPANSPDIPPQQRGPANAPGGS